MSITRKKIVQAYYSQRACDYDKQKSRTWKSLLGFKVQILDEIVDTMRQLKERVVLEVGVGSGRTALPLMRKMSLELVGIDLSKEMLNIARLKMSNYKQKFSLLLGDAEHLPFRNDTFTSIICISMLHYLAFPEAGLEEFSRVLKGNGVLVYGDVTLHEQDDEGFLDRLEKTISHAHAKYWKPSEMKKLMESGGFRVDRVEVIPYKKSYKALIEDKARYFDVEPRFLYERLNEATEEERTLYGIENDSITLFYTLIKGTKQKR
jgi:ubiquinone/menaquinone biosynthesis C-methylase UbiE